jgi:RNA polymerase sigma-70 factor (ECF subfamily)
MTSLNTSTSSEHLLRRAQAGEDDALGSLLEQYRGYLSLLARVQISRRLQGKVDAADLVQETFLEAHRSFARFQGTTEKELVSWLRQILAANLADLLRRYLVARRRDVRLERELTVDLDHSSQALGEGLVAGHSSPSQQAARREQAVLLAQALACLPEHYREVLILHHLEGLSFPEVGRRLGRSLDSVKNVWTRALARLRRSLGDLHEPP